MNYCRVLRKGSGVVFGQSVFHLSVLGINVVFRSAKARTFAERKTTLFVVARKRLPTPFALLTTKSNPTVIVLPVLSRPVRWWWLSEILRRLLKHDCRPRGLGSIITADVF
jgi:hypothetical protein